MSHSFVLFDDIRREKLLPFTYLRAVGDIRIGILTIREKWEHYFGSTAGMLTQSYLQYKYPSVSFAGTHLYINGGVLPNPALIQAIHQLSEGQSLQYNGDIIAAKTQVPVAHWQELQKLTKGQAYSDAVLRSSVRGISLFTMEKPSKPITS